jgi:DNA-binding NtrC family response regulator
LKEGSTILIADRNPHVREYLRREMISEGYRVRLANSKRELLNSFVNQEPPDLVILDPDLPDGSDVNILDQILEKRPSLPIVVHTYHPQYLERPEPPENMATVEKTGTSIEGLKKVVLDLLRRSASHG